MQKVILLLCKGKETPCRMTSRKKIPDDNAKKAFLLHFNAEKSILLHCRAKEALEDIKKKIPDDNA
jgi:hypothetical protein